ncbi:spore gernimation protein [Photobacterium sp. 1_MG-2023]|uniref:spore gernimation protein n=1 Tax=Photobacterium sp. 1_MG-2023 TaxID=3062646 RepID=UPI0026E2D82B|nr:spore gernimation protein [Photobacterium sp. 1_MG-2023]MDO6708747.1 spore gernimation protein [Photobacterium sp. 1_MG-2023]
MKKQTRFAATKVTGIFLLSVNLFTVGCSEPFAISAEPVKDVDQIDINDRVLNVYCPRGICQFELSTNQETDLVVNMFYGEEQPFTKIEGVSVTGAAGSSLSVESQSQFKMLIQPQKTPVRVQVIDYYR